MKLVLIKIVICFAVALAAPADKSKRDILPGDPRFGSERSDSHFGIEHNHHHHDEHVNEVQVLKAAGGYVGSYTVPDNTEDHSFQIQPQLSYGPPSHTPGKPLGTDFFTSSENLDKSPVSVLVPSTSYGIPDTTQLLNNNFVSIIDDKKPTDIKTIIQEEPKIDTVHVEKTEIQNEVHDHVQPTADDKHVETIPRTVSLPQVKVTATHVPTKTQGVVRHSVPSFTSSISNFPIYSYSSYSNIPVKTIDRHVQVQVPHTYHVPVTKHVAVPVPVPHTVEIPKPYYVRVPQPVQVTVDRPYPVEVPHPVPYPVSHYVKTSVPVAHQHHVTVDTKANPLQTFFDNTQSTFQNVPQLTFSNPLEGFQNAFDFELPSFPSSISSFIPFLPQQSHHTTSEVTAEHTKVPFSINGDSITIDNPINLKPEYESTVTKTVVQPITHSKTFQHKQQGSKPSTACAGCIVPSSSKQEYVQSANGDYVY